MSTSSTIEKYVDSRIPMVTISINNFSVSKTLIDLGAAINVMTTETIKYLNFLKHSTNHYNSRTS